MLHFDGSEYDFNRWKSYGAYKWDFESLSKGNNFNDGCNTESKTCLKNSNKVNSKLLVNIPNSETLFYTEEVDLYEQFANNTIDV